MILNELAQWAVLLFILIFVVGLTRQLGRFLVDPQEAVALEQGPKVGKRLPKGLIPGHERARFSALIRGSGGPESGGILLVREECPGCSALLESLAKEGAPESMPILAVSASSGAEHRAFLETVADVVVEEEKLAATGFRATPFVILVDADLRILHKQVTTSLQDAVARWQGETRATNGTPGEPEHVNEGDASSVEIHNPTKE